MLAYSDVKERFNELDGIASNTPAQVEMKPVFSDNAPDPKFENTDEPKQIQSAPTQTQSEKLNQNDKQNEQKLKNIQQNRNDDIFK